MSSLQIERLSRVAFFVFLNASNVQFSPGHHRGRASVLFLILLLLLSLCLLQLISYSQSLLAATFLHCCVSFATIMKYQREAVFTDTRGLSWFTALGVRWPQRGHACTSMIQEMGLHPDNPIQSPLRGPTLQSTAASTGP